MDNFIQDQSQQPKKNPVLKLVIALIILSLVGGTGYYFMQSDGGFFRGMIIKNVDKKVTKPASGEDSSKKTTAKTSTATKTETKKDFKSQAEAAKAAAKAKAEQEAKAKLEQEAAERAAARTNRDEAEERDGDNDDNESREEEIIYPYLTVESDDSFEETIYARDNEIISRFRITASVAKIEIDELRLRFSGFMGPNQIRNIRLYDSNNTFIDEVAMVNDEYKIVFGINSDYSIESGETQYFYVLADIYSGGEMNLCFREQDDIIAHEIDHGDYTVRVSPLDDGYANDVCSRAIVQRDAGNDAADPSP